MDKQQILAMLAQVRTPYDAACAAQRLYRWMHRKEVRVSMRECIAQVYRLTGIECTLEHCQRLSGYVPQWTSQGGHSPDYASEDSLCHEIRWDRMNKVRYAWSPAKAARKDRGAENLALIESARERLASKAKASK